MNAAEAARKAALIMSERGHCKNMLEDPEGRVCYMGALMYAIWGNLGYEGYFEGSGELLRDVTDQSQALLLERGYKIEVRYPHIEGTFVSRDPISYNNDERTSGEDVIMLLKETAEVLEAA